MKKAIYRFIVLAILVGGGWYGYHYYKQRPEKASSIATAKVQRGDVVIRAFTRGQLNAVRVYPLYAPNLNGTVQATALAAMGSLAKEKDLIVEYDDSELLAYVDAEKLSLDSVDESIKSAQLNQDITRSRDKVSLLAAQYGVKRADLNVQQNDVIDVIDQKKNLLHQDTRAHVGDGCHQAKQRRELQFRHADAGHPPGRRIAGRHERGGPAGSFRDEFVGQDRRNGPRQPEGRPGDDQIGRASAKE